MTNLAEVINEVSSISAVDRYYEAHYQQRWRLGLSQVGHKCKRYLWYKHFGYQESQPPSGRTLRLFQLGNLIEDQLFFDLTSAGLIIRDQQKQIKFSMDGITLRGSCDGIISGLIESGQPHLWECKSMNAKGFKKLLMSGYEAYNPQYKAQVHAYMLGLGLDRAFVTVYNKDTSDLYQERIYLQKSWIIDLLSDVFTTLKLSDPPERLCPRVDHWEAKWCNFYQECFNLK